MELLEAGLKNDSKPETFPLRHKLGDSNYFPCLFIKVVPLQSWGPSFNFSIWYLEIIGDSRPDVVKPREEWYRNFKETETMRLCLKFLRDQKLNDICEEIQCRTGVLLEHPLIAQLYHILIEKSDYSGAEKIIVEASEKDSFDDYCKIQSYAPKWRDLGSSCSQTSPGLRGGHHMVLDTVSKQIFLFGGWDGVDNLSDLWSWDLDEEKWTCLCRNAEKDGGPGPRSCHKMVLDQRSRQIFLLGKFVDYDSSPNDLQSDFYAYHIPTGTWQQITGDTAALGGPKAIYGHQMVLDEDHETIFCFGGQSFPHDSSFSGLYSYHIPTNTWTLLREDSGGSADLDRGKLIKGRTGHAMVADCKNRSIYILAGQREKDGLTDLLIYNMDTEELSTVMDDLGQALKVPCTGLSHRGTFDAELGELYVWSSVCRERKEEGVETSLWVHNLSDQSWSCVFKEGLVGDGQLFSADDVPPRHQWEKLLSLRREYQIHELGSWSRMAHQMVYDQISKTHYFFGVSPSWYFGAKQDNLAADFWELKMVKPSKEDIVRECQWELRKAKFLELASRDSVAALEYLQTEVAQVVLEGEKETQEFHSLINAVLKTESSFEGLERAITDVNSTEARHLLLSRILKYFPKSMTPPDDNLVDLVQM